MLVKNHAMLALCYVPPCDSQYYLHDAFGSMEEEIMADHMRNSYVIMSEMNFRFWKAERDLAGMYVLPSISVPYPIIEDDER